MTRRIGRRQSEITVYQKFLTCAQCGNQSRDGRRFTDREDKSDGEICGREFRRRLYSDAG